MYVDQCRAGHNEFGTVEVTNFETHVLLQWLIAVFGTLITVAEPGPTLTLSLTLNPPLGRGCENGALGKRRIWVPLGWKLGGKFCELCTVPLLV